jgi:hypothetical protein
LSASGKYENTGNEFENYEENNFQKSDLDQYADKYNEPEKRIRPKKFVIEISPENISYIENMNHDERNLFINEILTGYLENENNIYKGKKESGLIKNIVVGFLIVMLGLPLIMMIINMSLSVTLNGYSEMQGNFERLYRSRGR